MEKTMRQIGLLLLILVGCVAPASAEDHAPFKGAGWYASLENEIDNVYDNYWQGPFSTVASCIDFIDNGAKDRGYNSAEGDELWCKYFGPDGKLICQSTNTGEPLCNAPP
jgi:hypothetical protein